MGNEYRPHLAAQLIDGLREVLGRLTAPGRATVGLSRLAGTVGDCLGWPYPNNMTFYCAIAYNVLIRSRI